MPTPKSKGSKQKLRRWSFEARLTKDGETHVLSLPAVTIGNSADAQKGAQDVARTMLEDSRFAGHTIHVQPIGHETLAVEVVNQIHGLNDEGRIITLALRVACESMTAEFTGSEDEKEKQILTLMGQFAMLGRERYRHQMLREQGIDPDTIVPAEEVPAEPLPEAFAAHEVTA